MDEHVFNRDSVDLNEVEGVFSMNKDCCSTAVCFICGRSICPIGFLAWIGACFVEQKYVCFQLVGNLEEFKTFFYFLFFCFIP